MSWSLGEVKALSVKAARGAGLSWGMADEAGFAVQWLQSFGAPGAAALADYLDWRDNSPQRLFDLCPIHLGTAIMDADRGLPEQIGRIRHPLLLAPFVANSNPPGMVMEWPGVVLALSEAGLVTQSPLQNLLMAEAECMARPAAPQVAAPFSRVPETEAGSIERLNVYAARTYAPATEASRMGGAGAGITDND